MQKTLPHISYATKALNIPRFDRNEPYRETAYTDKQTEYAMGINGLHGTYLTGFLRERQIRPGMVPVAHSTFWQWIKEEKFPAPVKLSERVTAWRVADVQAWIDNQGKAA